MSKIALHAHFDGERIILDEPFELSPNAALLVTVLSPSSKADPDSEEVWLQAAGSSGAFAFLAEPAEDIYTGADGESFQAAALYPAA